VTLKKFMIKVAFNMLWFWNCVHLIPYVVLFNRDISKTLLMRLRGSLDLWMKK